MRKQVLIALAAAGLVVAGLAAGTEAGIPQALAQSAPAPAPPPDGHPGPGPWQMPWHHAMHGDREGPGGWHHMATFALLHRPADRALSGADVQKIAEGYLLWNGNHSWKITGVTEQDEATVGFNVATASGDVIARFTMNRHTGEVTRVS